MKPKKTIRTTFQPHLVRAVDEATFTDLSRRGLILEVMMDEPVLPEGPSVVTNDSGENEPVAGPVDAPAPKSRKRNKVSGLGSKDPDVEDVESPKADDDHEAL